MTAVVDDREMSTIKATREAKEARDEVEMAAAELDKSRIEIADLLARNRDLESKLEDAAERFRAVERSGSTSTTEGLTDVLHAAERALARLTDGARKNAEKQLGETERVRDSMRQEIERLGEWRSRMAPLAESIPGSIEDVRKEVSAIADRLREALGPATNALDVLAARLSDLAESPEPPPRTRERQARSSRWERRATDPLRDDRRGARGLRVARRPDRAVERRVAAHDLERDDTRGDDDVHLTLTEARTWTSVAPGPSRAHHRDQG